MAAIKYFEELKAWQKGRELAGFVYSLTRKQKFSRDFGLSGQIREAAGSVMHNIAEGFESGYDPEFARFLKWRVALLPKCNPNFIWQLMQAMLQMRNSKKLMYLQ